MTISSTDDPIAGPFHGNDSQTEFDFEFKVFAETDVAIVVADSDGVEYSDIYALDSDFSVTMNGDQETNPGGTVTYPLSGDPLADGWTVTVVSAIPYTQPASITSAGGFYPTVVGRAFDRCVLLIKQVRERVGRALVLPVSLTGTVDMTLPYPEAGSAIGWNADSNGLVNIDATAGQAGVAIDAANKRLRDLALVYLAAGDGETDDTTRFAALEAAVVAEDVDLAGRTYLVDAIPTGNRYFNGFFKLVDSATAAVYAAERASRGGASSVLANLGDKSAKLIAKLTRMSGEPTENNTVQSYCVDEVNGYQFSHAVTTGLGVDPDNPLNDEASVIQRYVVGPLNVTAVAVSDPNWAIGHQGLTVEHLPDGETRLWGSRSRNGQMVVRFKFVPNAPIEEYEEYILFPGSASLGSCTPTISYGQRFLVAKYNKATNAAYTIRIFDLQELVAGGPGDYSDRYLREFDLGYPLFQSDGKGLQDMCFHEDHGLVAIAGSSSISVPTRIGHYSPTGEFVGLIEDLQVGKRDAALTGAGTFYEPESITWATHQGHLGLAVNIAMGNSGSRVARVYHCGMVGKRATPLDYYTSEFRSTRAESIMSGGENGCIFLIGDSIGNGAGPDDPTKGVAYRLSRSVLNHQDKGPGRRRGRGYATPLNMQALLAEPGIATTGAVIDASGHVSTARLELNTGETLTITNREFTRFAVFYDKASAGDIEWSFDGGGYTTIALTAGSGMGVTALTDIDAGSYSTAAETLTIRATGGTVVLAGLVTTRPADNQPFFYTCCISGTTFSHYNTTTKWDEIEVVMEAFGLSSSDPKVLVLMLGTNSMVSDANHQTPAEMIADAQELIDEVQSRVGGVYVVLTVPLQPLAEIEEEGYSHQDYRDAILEHAFANNYGVLRADLTEPSVNYDLLADTVHPSAPGYSALDHGFCKQINIPRDIGL